MKIYELLDSPDKWTRCNYAKTKDGDYCKSNSSNACCWCLYGAMLKCYPGDHFLQIKRILESTLGVWIETWNDEPERTFEEVRQLCINLDI